MRFTDRIVLVLVLVASGATAVAADVEALFEETRDLSDARTNVACGLSDFPAATSATSLPKSPARKLPGPGSEPPRPFLRPPTHRPAPAVTLAERAITAWQDAFFGSDDEDFAALWPDGLPPQDLLELKLAIERGDDRHTLHHIPLNDLESDEPRDAFTARLKAPAAALRLARGGAPALRIINTDVDDTVFASLWDRGRYAHGTPYPGVVELLAAQGDFLVVLTARPSVGGFVSGRTRAKFLDLLGLRGAPGARIDLAVAPGDALEILDSLEMGLVKAETLLWQRRLYPEADSIFNGDSGQGDWIAALILRDLDPQGFPYATIHDVRPWSRRHKEQLRAALATNARLEGMYRRALGLRAGRLSREDDAKLDAALSRVRGAIDRALGGPHGRLDAGFLLTHKVHLFRNHVALALDLAAAGRIPAAAAARVTAVAARDVRFLPANPFGFDEGERERLLGRLAPAAVESGWKPK